LTYDRQLDILDPSVIFYPVTLIGCGGIGSPTSLVLAKMGCSDITLMDADEVEEHNLPNQLFRLTDIDSKKVVACQAILQEFSTCSVRIIPEMFNGTQDLSGIVISGVDNMAARQTIWEKVKYNLDIPLYIDARLGGEVVQVFTIQPCQIEDIELYEKHLFLDEEAEILPCTARAIMYTGFVVAGLIASQSKKWLKNEFLYHYISLDLKTMTNVLQ